MGLGNLRALPKPLETMMSGPVLFIRESLVITPTQVEILVGSLNVVSLVGSLASGQTSDWIGRRYMIVPAASTFLIGALLMGLGPSSMFLMAGRVVGGIGVGYALMIAPVFTAEISPAMTWDSCLRCLKSLSMLGFYLGMYPTMPYKAYQLI